MKNKIIISLIVIIIIITIFDVTPLKDNFIKTKYYAKDFDIEVIKSEIDYDSDGIFDYQDILKGAKSEALRKPKYISEYYKDGYPPDDKGVCTDVIWRALKDAGYNLKDMIDKDIKENTNLYKRVYNNPDPNIDFRRVPNLKVFFDRKVLNLTKDIKEIKEFQPGDIVIFGNDHIAIISDIRNRKGIPYLIHNANQRNFEENSFERWEKSRKITGHYRFLLN